MTQDEIIEMAKQAGYSVDTFGFGIWDSAEFNRFAKLVAEHERDKLIDAAMKAAEKGIDTAIALEREACARLRKGVELKGKCSTEYEEGFWEGLEKYEELIRARGQA